MRLPGYLLTITSSLFCCSALTAPDSAYICKGCCKQVRSTQTDTPPLSVMGHLYKQHVKFSQLKAVRSSAVLQYFGVGNKWLSGSCVRMS